MARGVNKVILIGNIGKDPEVRHAQSGAAIANVTVATSESWKDKSGQQQERTEWHNIVFFERLAEIVGDLCQKGTRIYVEGSLRTRKWQDKEGNDRYTTEIAAKEMQVLGGMRERDGGQQGGGRQSGGQSAPRPQPGQQRAPARQAPPAAGGFDDFDDDIPF